jgi:hypothetical protein
LTNTLHRYSEHYAYGGVANPKPVQDDYIVFAMSSRGLPDPDQVIGTIDGHTTVAAVFDNFEAMRAFVEELKATELGISINISAPIDEARHCCREAGITRHSVEYSIGFCGRVDKLPDAGTLELSTMCGHGMVSANFTRKMLEWVKENRRTPEEAAHYLARFCICGVFNITRAERILNQARFMNR